MVENIRFVLYRLPAFFIGYLLAPFTSNGKRVLLVWLVAIPLVIVGAQRILNFGYCPYMLVLSLTVGLVMVGAQQWHTWYINCVVRL